jgi:hypothetical protein
MPQVTVDLNGNWQGSFQCRIKSGITDEAKVLYVRSCLNSNSSCGTSFQSDKSISLSPIQPTPTPTPTPTSSPSNTPTPLNSPTPTPTIKPTPTPTLTITPLPKATTEAILNKSQKQVLSQNSNSLFSIPSQTDSKDSNIQSFSITDKQVISKILIFIGVIFMILCGIVISYPKIDAFIKQKNNQGND